MVIRKGEEYRFKNIHTLDDLRALRVGVGNSWPDRAVLESAKLSISSSPHGDQLWRMLNAKRFDFMPWGIHQVWHRLDKFGDEFEVEPNIMLSYPIVSYFYVNKEDDELFTILSEGMHLALEDGSYEQMLYQSPLIREAVKRGNLSGRRVISIQNPHEDFTIPYLRNKQLDLLALERKIKRLTPKSSQTLNESN